MGMDGWMCKAVQRGLSVQAGSATVEALLRDWRQHDDPDYPRAVAGLQDKGSTFRESAPADARPQHHDRRRAMSDQHSVSTIGHRLGQQPPMLVQDPLEPSAGIIVRQQAVRDPHALGAKGNFTCVARPEHGSGEDWIRHRNSKRLDGLADPAGLLAAFRREVSLTGAVSDPIGAVTGHTSGVRMSEEQDEPATAQTLHERPPFRLLHSNWVKGSG